MFRFLWYICIGVIVARLARWVDMEGPFEGCWFYEDPADPETWNVFLEVALWPIAMVMLIVMGLSLVFKHLVMK